jgi:hypothetical protein
MAAGFGSGAPRDFAHLPEVQSGACWKKEAGGGQAAAAGRQAGNALFVICIACLRCEKKSSKLIVFFFKQFVSLLQGTVRTVVKKQFKFH